MSAVEKLAREILDTRRLALGHATAPQLGYGSLDGGRIDFRDWDGNRVGGIGVGEDGGIVVDYDYGPKPGSPSRPTVSADAGMFRVEWDGTFVPDNGDGSRDGQGLAPTSDLDRVEVHASMDENFVPDRVESFAGAFSSLDGGSFTFGPLPEAGTYYFRLVARSKAGKFSAPSERVEQELAIASMDLAVTDAWLTGEAAQTTADGKNSIYRGPDEPVADPDRPFKDGDIWFEMTDDGKSIPNIWDETAGAWVANDDYRQSEIERVQQELREELDTIVVDGSGTKNFYTPDMPTEGMREGDLWFNSSDKNKPYIYQDGEWITVRDSFSPPGAGEDVFALLDEAGTTKYAIDNQWASIPGFTFTPGATGVEAEVPDGATAGTATVRLPLTGSFNTAGEWQITAEDTIQSNGLGLGGSGSFRFYSPGAAPTARIVLGVAPPGMDLLEIVQPLVVKEDKVGSTRTHSMNLGDQNLQIIGTYPSAYAWSLFLEVTVDSVPGNTVSGSGQIAYAVGGKGIVDKAITTEKIATGAITAESGIIGSINAGTITVGEMDGARIKAGTINANLALIESSIGSTLIKDGAILTDHIKAGAITAESGIIGSIDANVITVGKIMGNQLDADAINGKTITGATIRTASSGSRVELTHNGLKQYNSLGATIVDMTSGSFTLQGGTITGAEVRTSASGARVELDNMGLHLFDKDSRRTFYANANDGSLTMIGDIRTASLGPRVEILKSPSMWGETGSGINLVSTAESTPFKISAEYSGFTGAINKIDGTFGSISFSNVGGLKLSSRNVSQNLTIDDSGITTSTSVNESDWVTVPVRDPFRYYDSSSVSTFKVKKVNGIVTFQGVAGGSGIRGKEDMCTLPSGYRPAAGTRFSATMQGSGGNTWQLIIYDNGIAYMDRYGPGDPSQNTWYPFYATFAA